MKLLALYKLLPDQNIIIAPVLLENYILNFILSYVSYRCYRPSR